MVALRALQILGPETAHSAALLAIRMGLAPLPRKANSSRLAASLAGISLPNPIGLAAGFDKNALVFNRMLDAGFGFVEVGTVTPEPQAGNPKPRHFRLRLDRAAINQYGFNNDGQHSIAKRLERRKSPGVVGINIGANKDSRNRPGDYSRVLSCCGRHADFATVNVSSPNTPGLRDLQEAGALKPLIEELGSVRDELPSRIPLLLKVSPDLARRQIWDIAETSAEAGIDGIVATNTTLSREGLRSKHRSRAGGLSGLPLFDRSTAVLAEFFRVTRNAVPLVGVGGIDSAQRAFTKILAGASALQLHTSLAFNGLAHIHGINSELDQMLAREGFGSVGEAVGSRNRDFPLHD